MNEQLKDDKGQPAINFEGERGRQLARVLAGHSLSGLYKLDQEEIVIIEDLGYGVELTAPGLTVLVAREAAVSLTDMPARA